MKQKFTLLIFIFLVGCTSIKFQTNCCIKNYKLKKYGRVLLVVAHQDDEVFILSRLKSHLEVNDTIFVIWTAASYQKGEKYKNTRIKESKTLMKKLGVSSHNLFFLKYPDGLTYKYIYNIFRDVKNIIEKLSPKIIYVSAFECGHIDHDIANFVVDKVIKNLNLNIPIIEFPEYSGYDTSFFLPFKMRSYPDSIQTNCIKLSKKDYKFVINSWKIFKSQYFPLHYYIKIYPGELKTFGFEYFRRKPEYNYLKCPYSKIAYEKFLNATFIDFKNAVLKLNELLKEE